ncbi:Trypanosomal VSG domain containing protein [Trypanosoma brucei equiperdum]|uniref:Trypanosomal VSG domain containing protein n=1 Tax=Trypanosoma brucei equiperdum TaxID=630700 RepID=A0A3L6L6A0_9TRYP|nr:Trypanosomal VSG domain containing protein [Trypanosoma brucei equiperdum]
MLDAINGTTRALTSLLQTNDVNAAASEQATIPKLANQAIYGDVSPAPSFQLKKANSNRETTCGQRTQAAGTAAGDILAADLICICASDGSQTGNTGYYGSNHGQVTFTGANADQNTAWTAIKTNCGHRKGTTNKPAAHLRKLADDVYKALQEPKATTAKWDI